MALAMIYGIEIEDKKFRSVLSGWFVAIFETWLLAEPAVVFAIILLPRMLDRAMTPPPGYSQPNEKIQKLRRLQRKMRKEAKRARLPSLGGRLPIAMPPVMARRQSGKDKKLAV